MSNTSFLQGLSLAGSFLTMTAGMMIADRPGHYDEGHLVSGAGIGFVISVSVWIAIHAQKMHLRFKE